MILFLRFLEMAITIIVIYYTCLHIHYRKVAQPLNYIGLKNASSVSFDNNILIVSHL